MSNQSSTSNDKQLTIQDIIHEIEQKSKGGGYIYRGERELHKDPPHNGKVSSNLWREYGIEEEHFNIELVQKEMLAAAKKHTGDLPQDFSLDVIASPNTVGESTQEVIDFEILTEIQHYGGKTNLIDFTTDYFIALFFACDGHYDEEGRVILQKIDKIRSMIAHPRNPRHRVIAQKSVFVRPPKGFIEPREDEIITIPSHLKQPMLEHLRNYHAIFTESIYNDLYGFIRNQDIHGDAYTEFYRGFASQNRADEAKTPEAKQQEYEAAITHYTKAIELKPDFANAYNNLGNAYADKGKLDNAIRDYTTAIQLQPYLADAYNGRGSVYADKGELDNAIRDHTTAIQLRPNFAIAYYNRGCTYADKSELDNAITDYTRAIELKPDFSHIYNNRGNAYQNKRDFDSAINDYNAAIKLQPDDVTAYNNRGNAYQRKSDFDSAINDYNAAIKLQPDYAEAYNNRANAYQNKRYFDRAIQDYTQAIKLKPDYAEVYFSRGNTYQEKGNFDRAIQDYTQTIKLKPDHAYAYNNRGNIYLEKREFDQAIQDYTQAIQLKPDHANVYDNRGVAHWHKGNFDQAITDHTQAIQLTPDDGHAYRNRGELWLYLQEWEKAKVDLTIARDLGMDIITKFYRRFGNIANFERKTGVQLPADIVELLTPPQA